MEKPEDDLKKRILYHIGGIVCIILAILLFIAHFVYFVAELD